MNLFTKANLFYNFLKWRLTWDKRDTHCRYTVPGNPKFMGPRDAVKLIKNGSVVGLSGLAANHRPSIIYWAIRELFEETGNPRDLTLVTLGGIGGRGRVPGTLEELGQEGLCTRLITGHTETFKAMLRLADAGKLELQCIPQGIIALLFAAMGEGENSIVSETGIGTFVDPQTGRGSPVSGEGAPQLVTVENGKLRYTIPKVDVAIFNMPAADRKGNIYVKNCAMVAETAEITRAARRNGGYVIANVGKLVDEGYDDVFLPADAIDAVVAYPRTQQAAAIEHRHYWPMFTLDSDIPLEEGVEMLKFVNQTLGITPRRSAVDDAVARLAATIFAEHISEGSFINIGIGLPEEVCRLISEAGLARSVKFFSESGVLGGLPAPGVWFGAGVCPEEMISSAQVFHKCYEHLDASILGMLEFDPAGNVNVSKRGEGPLNYVGPGGFIDFSSTAQNVFFVCSWMVHGGMSIDNGRLKIVKRNKIKLVERVAEITFSGQRALERKQNIFYITNVGVFKLTARGLELILVVPGVDIRHDILEPTNNAVFLPESRDVPVADMSVMTGDKFTLELKKR